MAANRSHFRRSIQSLEDRRCLAAAAHVMDASHVPPIEEKSEIANLNAITLVGNTANADAFFTDLGRRN